MQHKKNMKSNKPNMSVGSCRASSWFSLNKHGGSARVGCQSCLSLSPSSLLVPRPDVRMWMSLSSSSLFPSLACYHVSPCSVSLLSVWRLSCLSCVCAVCPLPRPVYWSLCDSGFTSPVTSEVAPRPTGSLF